MSRKKITCGTSYQSVPQIDFKNLDEGNTEKSFMSKYKKLSGRVKLSSNVAQNQ